MKTLGYQMKAAALLALLIPIAAFGFCPAPNNGNANFTEKDAARVATELLAKHNAIMQHLPKLTSGEEESLMARLGANSEESREALGSLDYALYNLNEAFKNRINVLEGIVKSSATKPAREVLVQWVHFVLLYNDVNNPVYSAQVAASGLIALDRDVSSTRRWCMAWSNLLTNNIVLGLSKKLE